MIEDLTLAHNLRLALSKEGLTFKDLSTRARVSENTAFRLIEKSPVFVTKQFISVAKVLGFNEKQVREKARIERLKNKVTYSKKGRLYQLITEIIDLFEAKRERR